jgi:hypothetical protein
MRPSLADLELLVALELLNRITETVIVRYEELHSKPGRSSQCLCWVRPCGVVGRRRGADRGEDTDLIEAMRQCEAAIRQK